LECNKNKISKLESFAINYLSAWVLISNFDVYFPELDDFMKDCSDQHKLHPQSSQLDNFKKAFDKMQFLNIEVFINAENIEKAKQIFDEMLATNKVVCPKDGGGRRLTRRQRSRRKTRKR
jgi:pentatricopeptide repeat protein